MPYVDILFGNENVCTELFNKEVVYLFQVCKVYLLKNFLFPTKGYHENWLLHRQCILSFWFFLEIKYFKPFFPSLILIG